MTNNRIALLVGVDNYAEEEINNLTGAARDAKKFAKFLKEELPEGERFDVTLLENPTFNELNAKLKAIQKQLRDDPNAFFIFYFAGHGTRYCANSQVLLCSDADELTVNGTTDNGAVTPKLLGAYRIPGSVFYCFDTCRSVVETRRGVGDKQYNGASQFRDALLTRDDDSNAPVRNWMLTSCADRELACDDGNFMNAMLDVMRDAVKNYMPISLNDEFAASVTKRLRELSPKSTQRPTSAGLPITLGDSSAPIEEDSRKYAERLAQDSEKKAAQEKDANAKAKQNAERRAVQRKMEEAKKLADVGRYADAVGKIDDALRITSDLELCELLRKARGNYQKAAEEQAAKAAAERKAAGNKPKGVFSRRRFLYWGAAGTLVVVGGYCGLRRSAPSFFDANAGDLKTVTVNGVEYRFRWCPAGSFMMGSDDEDSDDDEQPVRKVTLTKGYWIQETETTQEQWESIMGDNPSYFKGANLPVENVSWNAVSDFLKKLNSNNDLPSALRFRLPTEAEWEYACRGGEDYKYFGSNNLDEVGWNDDNSDGKTHAVGAKKANGWGLHDMSGNVYEWCNDWYDKNYYANSAAENPEGPNSGSDRVRRGGGWDSYAWDCRCASRYYCDPEYRLNDLGFRLVLESAQGK